MAEKGPGGRYYDTGTPSGNTSGIDVNSYAAAAQGAGTDDQLKPVAPRKYIGVQSPYYQQKENGDWYLDPTTGYTRVVGTPDMGVVLTPGYYEGDEFALISGMGATPETIAAIQARMAEARLMPQSYRIGIWDADSVDAFKYVLTYANQTTQDWQHALDDLIQGAGSLPPIKGPSGPTFVAHLSNPDDIKKAFREVSYNMLGGKFIDDAQADAFVQTFQGQELAAQRAAFNASVGGGGVVEEGPSLGTSAEEQIETIDPMGVKAKRTNDIVNVLGSLLTQRSPQT